VSTPTQVSKHVSIALHLHAHTHYFKVSMCACGGTWRGLACWPRRLAARLVATGGGWRATAAPTPRS
jgi:hypothetical protein